MKKYLLILFVTFSSLALVGCGNNELDEDDHIEEIEEEDEIGDGEIDDE